MKLFEDSITLLPETKDYVANEIKMQSVSS